MRTTMPFWEAPPVEFLDKDNLIDFISVDHAIDRLRRMRPLAEGLAFEEDHSRCFADETHIVFGRGEDSMCDIRYSDPTVAMHLRGRLEGKTHQDHANVSLRFPSTEVGDLRDPSVPLRIIDAWISTLAVPTVKLLGDLTDPSDDIAELHAPLRRPLVDTCFLIAMGNRSRNPASIVRMHAPSPGINGSIVDKSGKQLLRRNVETLVLKDVPAALHFSMTTPDALVLNRLEFSVAQRSISSDPISIMRGVFERRLGVHGDPLLSAARKP